MMKYWISKNFIPSFHICAHISLPFSHAYGQIEYQLLTSWPAPHCIAVDKGSTGGFSCATKFLLIFSCTFGEWKDPRVRILFTLCMCRDWQMGFHKLCPFYEFYYVHFGTPQKRLKRCKNFKRQLNCNKVLECLERYLRNVLKVNGFLIGPLRKTILL